MNRERREHDGGRGTGDGRDPWWASGADPGRRRPHTEDPLSAHRAARRGEARTAGDAYDALEEAARAVREGVERVAGAATGPERPSGASGAAHDHATTEACQLCPVCSLIRVVGEARPELVEHLTEAARHLTLAAKAAVDAQAESFGGPDGLERIHIEGEEDRPR